MLQNIHSFRIGGYYEVPPDNLLLGIEAIKVSLFLIIDYFVVRIRDHEWRFILCMLRNHKKKECRSYFSHRSDFPDWYAITLVKAVMVPCALDCSL